MKAQDAVDKARSILPAPVFSLVRRIGTAFLTPIVWSLSTGHFKSSLANKALDSRRKPLPWYTYPAIEFLSRKSFATRTVLEFGAGQSTLWWSQRARRVFAYEMDQRWFDALSRQVADNVMLHLTDWVLTDCNFSNDAPYDVIVIDGLYRPTCAEISVGLLVEGGAIIFDNSDGEWAGSTLAMYADLGFKRVDFFGFCPGIIRPSCTSVLWRTDCFLLD